MAMSSCPVVVSSDYCYNKEVQLQMKGEWLFHYGGFTIRDTDGNDVFQVSEIEIKTKWHKITSILPGFS